MVFVFLGIWGSGWSGGAGGAVCIIERELYARRLSLLVFYESDYVFAEGVADCSGDAGVWLKMSLVIHEPS